MHDPQPRQPNIAFELALLLTLATLWGASYSFIKIGVATIPPVTLIAARTLIAGLLLLVIMRWRNVTLPMDAATWRRFLWQACLNSVIPWTMLAWSVALARRRARHHPQLDVADLHLLPDAGHHPPRGAGAAQTVRRLRRHGRHLPDRRGGGAERAGPATGRADRGRARRDLLRGRRDLRPQFQGPRSDGAGRRLAAVRRGNPDPAQPRGRPALDAGAVGRFDAGVARARGILDRAGLRDLFPAGPDAGLGRHHRAGVLAGADRRRAPAWCSLARA